MRERLKAVRRLRQREEIHFTLLLRNCQTVYAAAIILILGFGAIYRLAVPEAVDPWTARIALSAVCGGLLLATTYLERAKRYCLGITAALLHAIAAWFIIVTAVNDFSTAYGLGLVFTVAAIGFALLMTQEGVRTVVFYAASTTAAVSLLVVAQQPPLPNALLTIGAVVGISGIIVLSSHLRTHLVTSLEASERRFRKLSEAAFEAIFITDNDVMVDCNTNALILLGHSARERLLGCKLSDFMPQSDRNRGGLSRQLETPYRYESTMRRSDGTIVPVEIRGRSITEKGHDIRVVAVRDISEQKEYEQKLIESRRRIEETLEVRNAILTNVSHEFRTPLAIMLGYAEMLKEDKFDDATDVGQMIYDSGRKLNDTLNLILELAQIEAGGFALARDSVDVAELVDDVVRSHRQRASMKLLGLSFAAEGSNHTALVDRVRVLKIVDYLLDNAIKFTDEGTIDIRVESDAEWTRILVTDTGIGIDAAFLPQVFEPFKQESFGLTRSHGGLGVGLTIARHMAESMDGAVTVESRKGEGSVFTVSFPRAVRPYSLNADSEPRIDSAILPDSLDHGNARALSL